MQQDALKRVREMQKRARQTIERAERQGNGPPPSIELPSAHRQQGNGKPTHSAPAQEKRRASEPLAVQPASEPIFSRDRERNNTSFGGIAHILDALGLDHDRLLILAVLLVVMSEGGDTLLILALGYLFL